MTVLADILKGSLHYPGQDTHPPPQDQAGDGYGFGREAVGLKEPLVLGPPPGQQMPQQLTIMQQAKVEAGLRLVHTRPISSLDSKIATAISLRVHKPITSSTIASVQCFLQKIKTL